MVKIREAIVVEGRYDKNTLSQVVDAPILETAGFGIFKDRQQMALLRRVAEMCIRDRLHLQVKPRLLFVHVERVVAGVEFRVAVRDLDHPLGNLCLLYTSRCV